MMRWILILLLGCCEVWCQPAGNYAFAGISYGAGVAGTAIYARAVDSAGTYSFTVMDAVPVSTKPLAVTTSVATGVAQRVACLGASVVCVYIPGAAGIAWNGGATGWGWSTGGIAVIQPKNWKALIAPSVRVVKSSVSAGSGCQLIGGVAFGWGF